MCPVCVLGVPWRSQSVTPVRAGFSPQRVPDPLDAVVIGSGVGGLTVAATLAKAGRRVLVLEQHDQAGGCCHTFQQHGFEFDVGKVPPTPGKPCHSLSLPVTPLSLRPHCEPAASPGVCSACVPAMSVPCPCLVHAMSVPCPCPCCVPAVSCYVPAMSLQCPSHVPAMSLSPQDPIPPLPSV